MNDIPQEALNAMKVLVEAGGEAILKKEDGAYVVVASKRKIVWSEKDIKDYKRRAR